MTVPVGLAKIRQTTAKTFSNMCVASPAVKRTPFSELVLIAFFSAVALLVHLLTNGRYGYFRDELYYIAIARECTFTSVAI